MVKKKSTMPIMHGFTLNMYGFSPILQMGSLPFWGTKASAKRVVRFGGLAKAYVCRLKHFCPKAIKGIPQIGRARTAYFFFRIKGRHYQFFVSFHTFDV